MQPIYVYCFFTTCSRFYLVRKFDLKNQTFFLFLLYLIPLMSYTYKKQNIMGQMKQLLDNIFELELDESKYPDDLELDFQLFLAQKEAEKLAYEELLSDIK